MKIAINGFGRIGKTFLRILLEDANARNTITVAVINVGNATLEDAVYSYNHDSVYGMPRERARAEKECLVIGSLAIPVIAEMDATKLAWSTYKVDWVVDATGAFTHREKAQLHLKAGAKKVLITAPAHDEDVCIVPGVNRELYDPSSHAIVSLGSCTTNALMPLLKVCNDMFGITAAGVTSIHAYTATQALVDGVPSGKDKRRARAAALNIVPSTTGAAETIEKILPALADKVQALSVRVPVPTVSLVDVTFWAQKPVSVEEIHRAFERASKREMTDIVALATEPLVSSDYKGNSYSVVLDPELTRATGTMGKVFGWYDNEWGYSTRLKDFLMSVV